MLKQPSPYLGWRLCGPGFSLLNAFACLSYSFSHVVPFIRWAKTRDDNNFSVLYETGEDPRDSVKCGMIPAYYNGV